MAGGQRSGLGGVGESFRKAQPYIDASWQFVGAVGLLTLAGWWLDKRFHTQPWLLVAGAALGFVTGMFSMFRVILALDAKAKALKEAEQKQERQ
jgi:F0F1-type ATP synthase assembly protein I